MMKKDIERLIGANPETVFRHSNSYGLRYRPPTYIRIVGKKGHGYLVDRLDYRRGSHAEQDYGQEDRLPKWEIYKSGGTVYSCKDLDAPSYVWRDKHGEKTLEELAEIMTAESVAEWHEEKAELQVKPFAIAEILARTNLSERDLQDTPKAVVVALRDALFMAGVVA